MEYNNKCTTGFGDMSTHIYKGTGLTDVSGNQDKYRIFVRYQEVDNL